MTNERGLGGRTQSPGVGVHPKIGWLGSLHLLGSIVGFGGSGVEVGGGSVFVGASVVVGSPGVDVSVGVGVLVGSPPEPCSDVFVGVLVK